MIFRFRKKLQQKLPSRVCSRDDGVGGGGGYQQHIHNEGAPGCNHSEILRPRPRKGHLRQSSHSR